MTTDTYAPGDVESVSLWIGSADRPLFAWLDLPRDAKVSGSVVLCPSVGLEAAYSARAVRDLAHRLAGVGWAALRFDYSATGDSAGQWTDPDLVADWLGNFRTAIEYTRGLGTPRLAVVGLRLGAALAANELARGGGVDDFVMWDPCATGKAFLREQKALWAFRRNQALEWGVLREGETWGSGEASDDGSLEAPGALYSAETVEALQSLVTGAGDRFAIRELVLSRQGRKLERTLAERQSLPQAHFLTIAGQEDLLDAQAITPAPTLELIVSWLADDSAPAAPLSPPNDATGAPHVVGHGADLLERPLTIGPTGLFGMVTEPDPGTAASMPTVVFVNAGRIGHQGPARLWVDLSRTWARDGIRCVRVDLSGLGDSPTRPGRTENVEFPADALEDLREIRQFVTTEWGRDIVLVGLCSGGYHVIEWALAEPVTALFAVNPALLDYRLGEQPFRRFEPNEHHGLSDREAWGVTRPWVARTLSRLGGLKNTVRNVPGAWWVLKRLLVTANPADTFERLSRAGVEVLVVADSAAVETLRQGERRRWDALFRRDSFHLKAVPHLEHSLLERTGRERVVELLEAQLHGRAAD